jgi:hypothetical protein
MVNINQYMGKDENHQDKTRPCTKTGNGQDKPDHGPKLPLSTNRKNENENRNLL